MSGYVLQNWYELWHFGDTIPSKKRFENFSQLTYNVFWHLLSLFDLYTWSNPRLVAFFLSRDYEGIVGEPMAFSTGQKWSSWCSTRSSKSLNKKWHFSVHPVIISGNRIVYGLKILFFTKKKFGWIILQPLT